MSSPKDVTNSTFEQEDLPPHRSGAAENVPAPAAWKANEPVAIHPPLPWQCPCPGESLEGWARTV